MSHSLTKVLAVVAIVNFAAFILIGIYLGGYARGHVSGMPYYLQWYGCSTEVSRAVFQYSKWHGYAMLMTHAAALAAWTIRATLRESAKEQSQYEGG